MKQSDDVPRWVLLLVIIIFILFFIVPLPFVVPRGAAPNINGQTNHDIGFLLFVGSWGIVIVTLLIYAIVTHFRKPPQ